MKLDYLNSISSKEDDTRRQYLDTIGFETPKPKFQYLNERLGTLFKYNIPSAKPTKENLKIVFAVGSGSDMNLATHTVKIAERKTKPCIVKLSLPKNNTLKETSDEDLVNILPMYLADIRKGLTPNYAVFNAMSYTNIWYRKYFTKYTQNNIYTDFDDLEESDKLHIECTLTKDDLNIGPFINSHVITELCVYAGVQVQMFEKPTMYPPSYFNSVRPKEDLVDVVPLFKIQFEPIRLDSIPKTGLTFIFDIDTDNDIAVTTEEWDSQFIDDITAGSDDYHVSADGVNQNQNQDKLSISMATINHQKTVTLSGNLSELKSWLSTNPSQQGAKHKWFALDLILNESKLANGLLWGGDTKIDENILDGENTLTLWLKIDELVNSDKIIKIVDENDPDNEENIVIKFESVN